MNRACNRREMGMSPKDPKSDIKASYDTVRVLLSQSGLHEQLTSGFKKLWQISGAPEALLCIGTDRATGDSLGPLVGSRMASVNRRKYVVYGTLKQPVHASNLAALLRQHPTLSTGRVLAIDASLGQPNEVGLIAIGRGGIRPGAGVQKDLPSVGLYHVTGTVNIGGFMDYYVLQNTRLSVVMEMTSAITEALRASLNL